MEMDFAALLTSHFLAVVVLACLVVGYIIKHASFCKRNQRRTAGLPYT